LTEDGILYFSTNFRRFKMDAEALAGLQIKDITAVSIPKDFARDAKIHYCWRIQKHA
jgi:23S rRNA (guanine2445-N2)-methyltransferase / 23S rRNA (guanine2069-N7)-methyltransferase